MAKMDSLRWIPMMIQAYQTARTRVGTGLPMINIPSDKVNTNDSQMVSQLHQQPVRAAKKPAGNRDTLLRAKKVMPGRASSTSRLIRELRAANKKLNRLETIQQQLKAMENMFAGLREEIQQSTVEIQQTTSPSVSLQHDNRSRGQSND
jgi:hypothetical protein